MTKVNELESKLASKAFSFSSLNARKTFGTKFGMDDWRMVKDGASKAVDGETWWWCPHHVQEGVYDGLYVKYPPEKHEEWVEHKKNYKKNRSSNQASTSSATSKSSKPKLALSNSLKDAMVTNFQCTQEQADCLYSKVVQNSGDLN